MSEIFETASVISKAYNEGIQAASDYGKILSKYNAIHFAEWIAKEGWRYSSFEAWAKNGLHITTVDLYNLYENRHPLTPQEADLAIQQGLS